MENILPLALSARLPEPVCKPVRPAREDSATAEHLAEAAAAAPAPEAHEEVPAPYMALPVTPQTLITHNYTAALPVLEPESLGKEVRRWTGLAATALPSKCAHFRLISG